MGAPVHIYVAAAEKSGDQLGAGLIKELRAISEGQVKFSGLGGAAMQAQGVTSDIDISQLSILGIFEGLKHYPLVLSRVREAVDAIMKAAPDCVVLIDSWGFMVRVAKQLKKREFKGQIIKYVAPQVWATREGRSKILARYVDHVLSIHNFDGPYFEREGLPTQYVGNPVFDQNYTTGNARRLSKRLQIKPGSPVICVLFGSRLSEIQRLATPFADAIESLSQNYPDAIFISPLAETISTDVKAAAGTDFRLQSVIFLEEEDKLDCFALADVALACSGTVTTQLACAGVPTVAAYRLGALSYQIGKRLFKPKYISMINIFADALLIPECIQGECEGVHLAKEVGQFLEDEALRASRSEALKCAAKKMRGDGGKASRRAAIAVLDIVKSTQS